MATSRARRTPLADPLTTEELRERLLMLRDIGVREAEFYGDHLTKVVFESEPPPLAEADGEAVPEAQPGDIELAAATLMRRGNGKAAS
jgi:hypothetical protein